MANYVHVVLFNLVSQFQNEYSDAADISYNGHMSICLFKRWFLGCQ
jgi:hypothetical protein